MQYVAKTTTGEDVSLFVKGRIVAQDGPLMTGTLDVSFAQLCFKGPDDPDPEC